MVVRDIKLVFCSIGNEPTSIVNDGKVKQRNITSMKILISFNQLSVLLFDYHSILNEIEDRKSTNRSLILGRNLPLNLIKVDIGQPPLIRIGMSGRRRRRITTTCTTRRSRIWEAIVLSRAALHRSHIRPEFLTTLIG